SCLYVERRIGIDQCIEARQRHLVDASIEIEGRLFALRVVGNGELEIPGVSDFATSADTADHAFGKLGTVGEIARYAFEIGDVDIDILHDIEIAKMQFAIMDTNLIDA